MFPPHEQTHTCRLIGPKEGPPLPAHSRRRTPRVTQAAGSAASGLTPIISGATLNCAPLKFGTKSRRQLLNHVACEAAGWPRCFRSFGPLGGGGMSHRLGMVSFRWNSSAKSTSDTTGGPRRAPRRARRHEEACLAQQVADFLFAPPKRRRRRFVVPRRPRRSTRTGSSQPEAAAARSDRPSQAEANNEKAKELRTMLATPAERALPAAAYRNSRELRPSAIKIKAHHKFSPEQLGERSTKLERTTRPGRQSARSP
jgi:hypothetical protein